MKNMKKAFAIILLLLVVGGIFEVISKYNTGSSTSSFDEYGVWQPVSNGSLIAGQKKSYGPADVSRLEKFINYLVFGVSGDSLRFKIDVYGMMTYNLADTVKAVLLSSSTQVAGDSTIVFADTLNAGSDFPYIFTRIKNNSDSSVSSFNVWFHARPVEKTVIKSR